MQQLVRFAKLAPLMNRRLESLSLEELRGISVDLGLKVKVTEELKNAALSLLQGKSLDTVADMVTQPESIQQLVMFLKGGVASIAEAEIENHPDYEGISGLTLSFHRT